MPRFRKLPVEIDAWQWVSDDADDAANPPPSWINDAMNAYDVRTPAPGTLAFWPDGKPVNWYSVDLEGPGVTIFEHGPHIEVVTLEGVMRASQGDWIIKGINGELYPCKPDIFAKTYEAVREGELSTPPVGHAGGEEAAEEVLAHIDAVAHEASLYGSGGAGILAEWVKRTLAGT